VDIGYGYFFTVYAIAELFCHFSNILPNFGSNAKMSSNTTELPGQSPTNTSVGPSIYLLFIYLITEAKQSNAISKNNGKRVIIVPAANADEGLEPVTRGRKRVRNSI